MSPDSCLHLRGVKVLRTDGIIGEGNSIVAAGVITGLGAIATPDFCNLADTVFAFQAAGIGLSEAAPKDLSTTRRSGAACTFAER